MNYDEVVLTNKENGKYRTAPIGFSWTTLIFGIFPALFRKDWKWTIIELLIAIFSKIMIGSLGPFALWIVMAFMYNKLYIKDLLKNGFLPINLEQCEYIMTKDIITKQEFEMLKGKYTEVA